MAVNPFLPDLTPRHYLREWREERGLSQEELGKRVELTGATISRYEKGERGLPLELAHKLFEALDILPGQFFYPPSVPDLNTFAIGLPTAKRKALLEMIEKWVKSELST